MVYISYHIHLHVYGFDCLYSDKSVFSIISLFSPSSHHSSVTFSNISLDSLLLYFQPTHFQEQPYQEGKYLLNFDISIMSSLFFILYFVLHAPFIHVFISFLFKCIYIVEFNILVGNWYKVEVWMVFHYLTICNSYNWAFCPSFSYFFSYTTPVTMSAS